jgi:hypothetical protein
MGPTAEHRLPWLRHYVNDVMLRACAVFLLVVVLMPADGLGVELCLCRRFTGAPCPACGMTRSGAQLVRGHLLGAVRYHPFGPLVIPVIAGLGLLALAPRRWRSAAGRFLVARAVPFRPVYYLAVFAFVVYGVVRWGLVLGGWCAFPSAWP